MPAVAAKARIAQTFAALRAQGRTGLIPFVTAGDPQPDVTVPLMHSLVEAGADIIELGVPFSDPMADGPVIQRASERALKHKVSLRGVLDMVRTFRAQNAETPVVLMGYLNPIEVMGYEAFAAQAAAAGVDGVLTVDLPPEEGAPLVAALRSHGVDPIFLLAPNSSPARIAQVAGVGSGFLYYVSIKGVTGAAAPDIAEVGARIDTVRAHTDLPVGVGFGIRDAASAAAFAGVADAVIVGSALVRRAADLVDEPARIPGELGAALAEMRRALDDARG
ncbi:tryptophan synthase subunit alpha [Ectothiorhodospiraceae bacterium 2226]|nr:tryptophan synthase subunit alpha [Ectothiorhodospiraceae bacterium 2226]